MENLYLSVDLGGTSLRIGVLNSRGDVLLLKTLDSNLVRKPSSLVKHLVQEFRSMVNDPKLSGGSIRGAALGIPGLVDANQGIVYQSPHFPLWKNFSLGADLKPHLPFPCFIENDANKAALGEARFGAGKEWKDFIMLTMGTGIGGGIILDGKTFHGTHGFAGEVGHMIIDRQGPPGALGIRGTLETFCSLSGLCLRMKELQKTSPTDRDIKNLQADSPTLPEELGKLAKAGNQEALGLWREFGEALACGIANLSDVLGIFHYVVGGGLAGAWDLFMEPFQAELPKCMYPVTAALVKMVPAKLGNHAGLLGGLPMIREWQKS